MYVTALVSQSRRFVACVAIVLAPAITVLMPCTTVGAQGAALLFDGFDDVATIADPAGWAPYSPTTSLTVEAWIKPSDVSGTSLTGVVRGDDFVLAQDHGDNTALAFSIAIGPTNAATTPSGSLVAGRWDHFAGTYDGVDMRIYQNGELVAEEPQAVGGGVGIDDYVYIGFWPGAYGFPGTIDEVRIWNSVRSQAEIKTWMVRSITGAEPDLLGYWSLDEGSGQSIIDSSPFANDGVLGLTSMVEDEDPLWTIEAAPLAFFFDDFESGDTGSWSAVTP